MFCKLCQKEKKLIKSHILSKFLYKKIKDENNAFLTIEFDVKNFKKHKKKKVQIEDYDSNILCADCDNRILGQYEKYAKVLLYGEKFETKINPKCTNYKNPNDGTEYSICIDFDYKNIKNFLLSILWRASITNRPFFEEINLGDKHNERLRKILYENIETDEEEYPILITSFIRTKNKFDELILKPFKSKNKEGLISYIFMINGYQFIFFVKSKNHTFPKGLKKISLTKEQFFVSHFMDGMELDIFNHLLN
ncbi:MAG: hypothetical protein CSA38_02865 [Flavobacteriales bacterium]|nr:MAG: hypothetical protein CSA38_02865 [Flavobacteriales bacterium]